MRAWIAAAALLFAVTPSSGQAQEHEAAEFAATTLTLSASGEVRTRPDLAVIDLGVQAEARTAAGAFAQARVQMNAIASALHGQGVAEDDVQTSQLSLQAEYADGDGRRPRLLTGYQASNSVSVRLHDIGRVGALVDAMVGAGANSVNGVSFQLADPSAAEDEARRIAVKALQAKADLYAQATGYRIRRLVSLSEGGGSSGGPVPMFTVRRMAFRSTSVAGGELTVSASVNAQYELAR